MRFLEEDINDTVIISSSSSFALPFFLKNLKIVRYTYTYTYTYCSCTRSLFVIRSTHDVRATTYCTPSDVVHIDTCTAVHVYSTCSPAYCNVVRRYESTFVLSKVQRTCSNKCSPKNVRKYEGTVRVLLYTYVYSKTHSRIVHIFARRQAPTPLQTKLEDYCWRLWIFLALVTRTPIQLLPFA